MRLCICLCFLLVFLLSHLLYEQKKQTSIYMNALIACMNGNGFYDKANDMIYICDPIYSFKFGGTE